MNRWARSRRRIILAVIFLTAVVFIALPLYRFFYRTPTCFDGKNNGDETGVDCGGSCQRLCSPESLPLVQRGDPRVLTIATSTFEVVAVVENPNFASIKRAKYVIEIYGNGVIPIKTIEGEIYIPSGLKFAVFEGPFVLEPDVIPTRAAIKWQESEFIFEKNVERSQQLVARGTFFSRLDPPRLEAKIENTSREWISNVDVTALLYDKNGNIFAAAKTFIDRIGPQGKAGALFSWPNSFIIEPASIEILIKIIPDRSLLNP